MKLPRLLLFLLFLVPALRPAQAHVGSKDVYEQATVGPYQLYVTVRMPNVIPGQATVEVRSTGAPITGIHLTPLPLTGEASLHPPTSDPMKVSHDDPAFYTADIWIMAAGSWQVRFEIDGPSGTHTTAVPVPAAPVSTLKMDRTLGSMLAVLGLFLVLSMAGVVAAAIREARLKPGLQPDANRRRIAYYAMAGSLVFMAVLVALGAKWWNVEAADYDENIFQPLQTEALLQGNQLDLKIKPHGEAETRRFRSNHDFIPDHGHLMHLYAIRQPGMDAVYHLHPTQIAPGDFRLNLPALPSGRYNLCRRSPLKRLPRNPRDKRHRPCQPIPSHHLRQGRLRGHSPAYFSRTARQLFPPSRRLHHGLGSTRHPHRQYPLQLPLPSARS